MAEPDQKSVILEKPSNSAISEWILKFFFSTAPVLKGGPKIFYPFSRIFPGFPGNREKPSNSAISERILNFFFLRLRYSKGVQKYFIHFPEFFPVFREIGKNLLTQPFLNGFWIFFFWGSGTQRGSKNILSIFLNFSRFSGKYLLIQPFWMQADQQHVNMLVVLDTYCFPWRWQSRVWRGLWGFDLPKYS